MPELRFASPDEVWSILEAGDFDQLVGVAEDDRVEAKGQPYDLDSDAGKRELAKDLSAFANARGGVLVIGAHTDKDPAHATDVIVEVRPIPTDRADPSRYQHIVADWTYPPIAPEVRWFPLPADAGRGLIGIQVEAADAARRPVLLRKPTADEDGKAVTTMFGYAERAQDRAPPMGIHEIHSLLQGGMRSGEIVERLEAIESHLRAAPRRSHGVLEEEQRERICAALDRVELRQDPHYFLTYVPAVPIVIEDLLGGEDAETPNILRNPPRLRQSGFDVYSGRELEIAPGGGFRYAGSGSSLVLALWPDGMLVHAAPADARQLCWVTEKRRRDPTELVINQLALVEPIYTFCLLCKRLFAGRGVEHAILAFGFRRMNPEVYTHVLRDGPLDYMLREQKSAPGPDMDAQVLVDGEMDAERSAFQLVSQVYGWFGFDEDAIPYSTDETPRSIDSERFPD